MFQKRNNCLYSHIKDISAMWHRELKFQLTLIAITGAAAIVLLLRHEMSFDIPSGMTAYGTVALLIPFAIVFNGRNLLEFSNLLTGFVCMVVFNLCLTILTYAGTPLNAPLADASLMEVDAMLGIHLPGIVEWTRNHSTIQWVLQIAYVSVLPSTLLALVILGLDSDASRLREFVSHFMCGGLICTLIFFVAPAAGPFVAYGYELRPDQQRFLDHFYALRSGSFPLVSMTTLEGLITFPSFHTTWAALLAYAFRHYRWLWGPMLVINSAVIVSTMTTGWHYGADVIGGLLTAVAAILCTKFSGTAAEQGAKRAGTEPLKVA